MILPLLTLAPAAHADDSSDGTPSPITASQGFSIPSPSSQSDGATWSGDPVVNYQKAQNPMLRDPGLGSMQDFMLDGEDDTSPLGFVVRPDRRKLKSGEEAKGLLVVSVDSGGPAAKAGVKPFQRSARSAVEAVAVGTAIAFPPAMFAMLLVPVLESSQAGDRYDMIIGIDGARVTNLTDFEDSMRDVQPGEVVYLSLIRNGSRVQVAVTVPGIAGHPAS